MLVVSLYKESKEIAVEEVDEIHLGGFICSGMGMHLHGLLGKTVWGIECDPEIAECYRENHGGQLYVNYVQEIEPTELPDVDCLIATPSCKNASIASGGREAQEDVEVGRAIAQCIKTKLPKVFVIENVWGYRKFQSFRQIQKALAESGYYFRYYKLNCADWGVAQSRVRLYGVAVRGGAFWDLVPPGCKGVGWYRAIADLIPSLKETQLAPWQKQKFPCLSESCLIPGHSNWTSIVKAEKPASTVRAGHQSLKALIKRDGGGRESDRIYDPDEPAFTIRAFGRKASNHARPGNANLALGRAGRVADGGEEIGQGIGLHRESRLPGSFRHTGDLAAQGQFAEGDTAEAELAHVGATTARELAAVIGARRKFRGALLFDDPGGLGHIDSVIGE